MLEEQLRITKNGLTWRLKEDFAKLVLEKDIQRVIALYLKDIANGWPKIVDRYTT